MSILAECPTCRNKQSVKNRKCSCGEDLLKAKKSERVLYWIVYRLPNRKQKKEKSGYSYEEAKASDGKRKSQKKENRILDIKPDAKMTFGDLSRWFLGLETNKSKAYFCTLMINLNSFNKVFGDVVVNQIRPVDLEDYQAKRKAAGYSDSYIDQEVGAARTMINKAFDNNMVSGDTLRIFKVVKKLLKKNANARDVVLSVNQFDQLMTHLPLHTKRIVAMGFYTGMRKKEIVSLTWDKVDMKKKVIRLEIADTKDREPREVPISDDLHSILRDIPKDLHDTHVFLYSGEPISDIRTALKMACTAAEIPYGRGVKGGFTFHDLRHTFNTNMRKAGVPESVIMRITGHASREMFDRYDKVDAEDKIQAVNRLGLFLGKAR
ncbi:MAG: site-specific integrase [Syntrophales bacterium]